MASVAKNLASFFGGRKGLRKYDLDWEIASGGMSVVYRGHLKEDDSQVVAVKLITPEFSAIADRLEAIFEKGSEGEVAASLNHRNVVKTYEYGRSGKQYYIVMEYIDGPNLKQMIDTGDAHWSDNRFRIVMGIGQGLRYIHQNRLVHRDFCPKNVLMGTDNVPKIIDFGLAIPVGLRKEWKWDRSGTASYMAPEQVRGQRVDVRTDIYAFGVTAYETLTGKRPFREGRTRFGKMQPHLNVDPIPPREVDPDIPIPLNHIIMRAMEKNKSKRYQTMDNLMKELQIVAKAYTWGDDEME